MSEVIPPVTSPDKPKRARRTVQSWAEENGAAYVEAVRIIGPKIHEAIRAVMEAEDALTAARRNATAMAKEYQQAVDDCADAVLDVQQAVDDCADAEDAVSKAKAGIVKIDALAQSIADAKDDTPDAEDVAI